MQDFANFILHNWVSRVAIAANDGLYDASLVSWTSGAKFNNILIQRFLKQKLLDYINKQTELATKIYFYLVDRTTKEVIKLKSDPEIEDLYDEDKYIYVYLIKLTWE